jgi:hypothetical protein
LSMLSALSCAGQNAIACWIQKGRNTRPEK